jgi:hypothetical protein
VEETEIEEVRSSVYLRSVVSVNGGTEEDVANRIKKVNGVFFQLYPVWRIHETSKGVKIRKFNKNVKSCFMKTISHEDLVSWGSWSMKIISHEDHVSLKPCFPFHCYLGAVQAAWTDLT